MTPDDATKEHAARMHEELQEYLHARPRLLLTLLNLIEAYDEEHAAVAGNRSSH